MCDVHFIEKPITTRCIVLIFSGVRMSADDTAKHCCNTSTAVTSAPALGAIMTSCFMEVSALPYDVAWGPMQGMYMLHIDNRKACGILTA